MGRLTSTCMHSKISAWYLNFRPRYYYFRFLKYKRLPCCNSPFGSDFYGCVTISMSFCICLPNFVQIGPSATELWHHIHFSRWRPRHRNSISSFGFRDFAHLGKPKSACTPNFCEISQSTAEILLLPVSEKWKQTNRKVGVTPLEKIGDSLFGFRRLRHLMAMSAERNVT